ncbi:MAG: transporter ATP-binding protein [Pseudonocardiales bacterium]|nr:transporter ATP-binding protein [Pseudonocardiales bacterium]
MQFKTLAGEVEAVSGVSFDIQTNETLAIVGESGSGKSVTALTIMGLLNGGRITSGKIESNGRDMAAMKDKELRAIRGNDIAMIFQDPMTSLDPLYSIGNQIVESIRLHEKISKKQAKERAIALIDQVGIPDARRRYDTYPHQLSGGQRQRVMIAIALACSPKLLIADEPTTALDVTVEAQILELMRELQRDFQMSLLLVTHDMGVVAEMADKVVVLYAGQVVEKGTAAEVLASPSHPYTEALFEAIPTPTSDKAIPLRAIRGAVPSLLNTPDGCRFNPRCTHAWDKCRTELVPLFNLSGEQESRCWLRDPQLETTAAATGGSDLWEAKA